MQTAFLAAILVAAQAAPAAQPAPLPPPLTAAQHSALRCGVAFAVVAQWQKAGRPEGADYPPLAERGREYFVRVAAKLMDETGANRSVLQELVQAETAALAADPGAVPAAMPGCLELLTLAGL